MNKPSLEELLSLLSLESLEEEGGLYTVSFIAEESLPEPSLPERYGGSRPLYTAIYYLLTGKGDSFSALHRLKTDEIWHFYLGDPARMVLLYPDGRCETVILGQDVAGGEKLQFRVPRETWQGCRLLSGGEYALMGTTMAPGFDPEDFELASYNELAPHYPDYRELIADLTRR
jgi:hypothetical protein